MPSCPRLFSYSPHFFWPPPAYTEQVCNVPELLPMVRNSGTDRKYSRTIALPILTLQSCPVKAKPLPEQWWLSFLPPVPNLGTDRGSAPLMPVMRRNPISIFAVGSLCIRPFIRPVKIMKEIKKKTNSQKTGGN